MRRDRWNAVALIGWTPDQPGQAAGNHQFWERAIARKVR